jgi:hypothetical protein
MKNAKALRALYAAGYYKAPSGVRDPRWRRYYQRWVGPGPYDWFEFPHDAPPKLVWDVINRASDPLYPRHYP